MAIAIIELGTLAKPVMVNGLVVAAGDSLEALLAGGVPNLELDGLSVNLDSPDLEVHADCWHEVVCENVIGESEKQ